MSGNEERTLAEHEPAQAHDIEVKETDERQHWGYCPEVDIVEESDSYRILADVPGADRDSIDVSFEDGILSIEVKVPSRYPENAEYALREFGVGNYHRRFRISEDVDVEHIDAGYDLGVLTVTLPKRQSAKRRQIEVKAG